MKKVFCVGMIKTGLSSLSSALVHLGYKHYGFSRSTLVHALNTGVDEKVLHLCQTHDSFSDWPWLLLYKEMEEAFPDAQFILSIRKDEETWFESLHAHALQLSHSSNVRKLTFGYHYPFRKKTEHLRYYHKHNESVRSYFKDKPEKLLEVCLEEGDSWVEVCRFLEKEIPTIPFPHLNHTDRQRIPLRKKIPNLVRSFWLDHGP